MPTKVRGRPGFSGYLRRVIAMVLAVLIGVLAVSLEDEDAFMLLFNSAKNSVGEAIDSFTESVGISGNKDSKNRTKNSGKKGTLNLALIDQIQPNTPKKGYIKELLGIARDAQKGKLCTGYFHFTLPTILGMWTNEIGLDGNGVPRYYFRPSEWKKDDKDKSFIGMTSNSDYNRSLINESGGIGPFQNIGARPTGKLNLDVKKVMKVSPKNNTRKYATGDCRFLPDAYKASEDLVSSAIKQVGKSKFTTTSAQVFAGLCNSRGSSGSVRQIFGSEYNSSSYVNVQSATKSDVSNTIGDLDKAYTKWYSDNQKNVGKSIYKVATAQNARFSALIVLAHIDGWYISKSCYKYYAEQNYGKLKEAWGTMYPKEKSFSKKQILARLKERTKEDISDCIQTRTGVSVSTADCNRVYGNSTKESIGFGSGIVGHYIWHVSTERASKGIYKHKYSNGDSPFLVSRFDSISFGYTLSTFNGIGSYVYANLLKQAGVNGVDPTNPESYINQQKSSKATDGTTPWTGELDSIYKNCNVNESKLSDDRAAVLHVAALVGNSSKYHYITAGYGYSGSHLGGDGKFSGCGKTLRGLDCSGFAWYVYKYAGFYKALGNSGPGGGAGYISVSRGFGSGTSTIGAWKKISPEEVLPGDLIVWGNQLGRHHVEIYLSGKLKGSKSSIWTIGAHGHRGRACSSSIGIIRSSWSSGCYVYRLKAIDHSQRRASKNPPEV